MTEEAQVHSVSLYEFHREWMEQQGKDFNFSEWVRGKIEEEARDAPAFINVPEE